MFKREQALREKFIEERSKIDAEDASEKIKGKELYAAYMPIERQDHDNQLALSKIVKSCGWPHSQEFKDSAVEAAFFIVQHAPLKFQIRYLSLIRESSHLGEIPANKLAFLEDRVRVGQNLPQIYGTQFEHDSSANTDRLQPVEDPAGLNDRRASIGLKPLDTAIINNRLFKFVQ